jgi:hypothetical protein
MKMLLEQPLTYGNCTERIKFAGFSFELIPAGYPGGNLSRLLFKDERNLKLDTVFRDLSIIIQFDLLILDPCGLEILERFLSTRDTYL